jgi:serine-type D-Ala-D-Ala carboxypeptidase/endopeptidase
MAKYILIFVFIIQGILLHAQSLSQYIKTDNKQANNIGKIVHNSSQVFLKDSTRIGLSIGIYTGGKEFFFNYGSIEKEKQRLPTSSTIYEIGSISKTFTGTLLAQAVKDKKVKIDDDVRLYLDGNYPNLEYNGKYIKLSHLVSYISGLPNFLPENPTLFDNPNYDILPFTICEIQNNYSKTDFLNDLHKVKLDTIPGYNYHYSNSGAQLLKYILEKVYKKPFYKILEEHISKPLKMLKTKTLYSSKNITSLAKGYNGNGKLMPYNPQILDAAGGIFSTSSDMLKYLKFHLNEKNEVVALSHKVTTGNIADYAIGLNWQEQIIIKKYKKIWQSGGTFGFGSYCVVYPELNLAIILLSNESDQTTQGGLEEIADKIFDELGIGN